MMINLNKLVTEQRNSKTMNLDCMDIEQICKVMNEEDINCNRAIKDQIPNITKLINYCVESVKKEGRVIYIGAGTSGRLGLLDAVECPPTFGVDNNVFVGLLAGGPSAFIVAQEGAEDSFKLGKQDLMDIKISSNDTVIGIAASGRTPYVIGALQYANEINCKTGCIVCNNNSDMSKLVHSAIELVVGPEILTGSTRLKAGTATKMALNMISTITMIKMGKVFQNLMVDVMSTNAKLNVRAENIVMDACSCSREIASKNLNIYNGNAKLAITKILTGLSIEETRNLLLKNNGYVNQAIASK